VSLPYVMECILAVWILTQQAIGYSVTSEEARRKAAALQRAVSQTAPAMKCYRWLKGFLKRFPFINVRAASSHMEHGRELPPTCQANLHIEGLGRERQQECTSTRQQLL